MKDLKGKTEESRIIVTDYIPRGTYPLGKGYLLRPVKCKDSIRQEENDIFDLGSFARAMALSDIDFESLGVYKDLVVFHTFITDRMIGKDNPMKSDSATYLFAEKSDIILVSNSKLEFLDKDEDDPSQTDFDSFPVEVSVGEDRESLITHIDYGRYFWRFVDFKHNPDMRSIYNRIQLWAYASNYTSLHRLYSNEYLPMSLYVGILDSMLPQPKDCGEVIGYCPSCKRENIKHPTRTWRRNFLNKYGKRFDTLLSIRSSTFHAANYLDYIEEWDRIGSMVGSEATGMQQKRDKEIFAADEMKELVKIELMKQFIDACD